MSAVSRLFTTPQLSASRTTGPVAPDQRLDCLRNIWHSLQLQSDVEDKWQRQERFLPGITQIRTLLVDECVKADSFAPNACLQFSLEHEVFHYLVTIAIAGPAGITNSVVITLTELIDIHGDELLTHEAMFRSVNVLIKWFATQSDKEAALLAMAELLFVCGQL